MRKLPRMHRQMFLTGDDSDTIASHSYRVSIIAWILAKEEGADPYKTALMALLHDMGEARTGDHNWVHKRYVKIYEEQVIEEQFGSLPFDDFKKLADEYMERKTPEAILAKDADLLDEVLLLREYEWQGNKEAGIWLRGKGKEKGMGNAQLNKLMTKKAKALGKQMYLASPSEWWDDIWTNKNR